LKVSKPEYEHDAPILVVEDDPFILETVTDVLQFEGYRVETAMNGLEGLAVVERVRPSLVLLDMRMPIMNGWDFARALMERGIRLPILVMTAAQDANRWANEIGADGYIAKPFHLTDLLDAVEGLLKAEPGDGHLH
jgi:two-component system, chemotaxis family, chemotaxis protein CheY